MRNSIRPPWKFHVRLQAKQMEYLKLRLPKRGTLEQFLYPHGNKSDASQVENLTKRTSSDSANQTSKIDFVTVTSNNEDTQLKTNVGGQILW